MLKIGIDAGHCMRGYDTGCTGVNGIKEEKYTRLLSEKVISLLKETGNIVYDCSVYSASSVNGSLKTRCDLANRQALDLFVSLHFNAFNGQAHGSEIYTYNATNHAEAKRCLKNLAELGYTNRGIKDGKNLYVIKHTKTKAMLIEVCFLDNVDDMKKFDVNKIAEGIVKGVTGKEIKSANISNTQSSGKLYRVQVGAFSKKENAIKMVNELKQKGYDCYIK